MELIVWGKCAVKGNRVFSGIVLVDHFLDAAGQVGWYGTGLTADMGAFFGHQFKFQLQIVHLRQHAGLVGYFLENHLF